MRVAIHQPNYAPWCGYFAKMCACDVFVFLDDAQFSKGSYTNRVQIMAQGKGGGGADWLTVPVKHAGFEPIHEVQIADDKWTGRHVRALQHQYARANRFQEVMKLIDPMYSAPGVLLGEFNVRLIRALASFLKIDCQFRVSSEMDIAATGDDRLIELVKKLGGDTYVSGPGGEKYQDEGKFSAAGIQLEVRRYRPIEYPQGSGGDFVPGLSILDALFHLGPETRKLLVY